MKNSTFSGRKGLGSVLQALRIFVLVGIVMFGAISLKAATKVLVGTATGTYSWTTAASWSPSGVPHANDIIQINPATGATVTVSNVPTLTIGALQISSAAGTTGTVVLNGAVAGNTLTINGTGSNVLYCRSNLTLGTVNITTTSNLSATGTIDLARVFSVGANSFTWLNGGLLTNSAGATGLTCTTGSINFTRAGAQTVPALTISGAGRLVLGGSGAKTLNISINIGATGALSLQGTATTSGIAPTYAGGTTIEYAGTAAQTISTTHWSLSQTTQNIIINNSSGVTCDAGSRSCASLALTTGNLILNTGDFTTTTLNGSGFSSTNMVVTSATSGLFRYSMPTGAGSYLFPIGENVGVPAAEYCGFTLSVAANSAARSVGFKVVDNANPPSLPIGTADYTTRYYVGETSLTTGTFTWSANLPYFTTDVVGNEANMVTGQATGSSWTQLGTVNTASNLLQISNAAIANLSTSGTNYAGIGILCPNPSGPNSLRITTINNTLVPVTMTGTVGLAATTNISGIVIFANTSNVNASPAEGSNYNVGDVLPSGSICIFRGGTVGLNVPWTYDASLTGGTDLLPNTFYYLNVYTYAEGSCNTNYSGTWLFSSMAPDIDLTAPGSVTACYNSPTTFNLPYTNTSGQPQHYGLIWSTAAQTAGFVNNPVNAGCGNSSGFITLPGSPIVVTVPSGIAPGTYTGYINPLNASNCFDNCTYNGGGLANVPSFTITVTSATAAPTGPSIQPFCAGATVSSLTATGTSIQWYASATGGSPLSAATPLVDGKHYYASQTLTGCEGTARLDVTAVAGLSGIVTVGSGGDYSTFNGASGLFAAVNARGLAGDLTVNVISDITETVSTALNGINYGCGGPWTMTIQPDQSVLRTVSGSVAGPIFNFNGADYVMVDGRPGGVGTTKYLTISNTNASNPAIQYQEDASNHTVQYCTVRGVNTSQTSGVIAIMLTNVSGGTGMTISHWPTTISVEGPVVA